MSFLPTSLYRAAQVRELDRIAIEEFAIEGYVLMQRAGQVAFDLMQSRWPQAKSVLVLAGTGNNGGDGYVVARLALEAGHTVRLIQMGDSGRIQGDALRAKHDYEVAGGSIEMYTPDVLSTQDVIVDALLGTGLEREVRQDWRDVIESVNRHNASVLAIDIPSGLHSDTGNPLGIAVRANATITFIGLKQGLFTGQASDYCGEIVFNDLQLPEAVYFRQTSSAKLVTVDDFFTFLPPRARTSHKGQFGHVLVVGGDHGMAGAIRMTAESAARMGAGLVSVATRKSHASQISSGFPVAMFRGVETRTELSPLIEKATVIAVGPGLGQSQWARDMLCQCLESGKPLVVDADALNILSREPVQYDNWILTPHPAEAARLLNVDTADIQFDRYASVQHIQENYAGVCVLKGRGTLVRSENYTSVCTGGNPGMATGGMGDVLTGIVAGLLAQGLPLKEAAEAGVCLHACAADCAAQAGERGLLATDLMPHIRTLANP